MAMTDHDDAYVMDLTALLKALRETRHEAAQVGQQLMRHLQACRDLDARTAEAVTQAVQRATAALQKEHEHTLAAVHATAQREQAALTQKLQQVVEQAAQVRRWLPWKVALLLLGGTLLVNAGGAVWWWWQQAEDLQGLRTHKQLAVGLTNYLATTLYPQLSKAQQHELEMIYKEAGFAPIGPHRR